MNQPTISNHGKNG